MILRRKYNVAAHVYIPIIKRGVVDFAVSSDWTPVAGDVKISKDGGAAANVTNLPVAITMGNGAVWDFSLTNTELSAAKIIVTVVDAATKTVEDQTIEIETYGNASAQEQVDFSDTIRFGLTALPNAVAEAAGGLLTRGSGAGQINQAANGQIDTNVVKVGGTTQTARDLGANIDVTISSRSSHSASDVWTVGTRALTDKSNFGISVASIQAIWDSLTSALTTTNSIGKFLLDKLDVVLSTRLATLEYTAPDNSSITAIKTKTDNLPSNPASQTNLDTAISTRLAAASYTAPDNTSISAIKAKTDNLPVSIKKNTTFNGFGFLMTDSVTHLPKIGLVNGSFTKQVSLDAGAFTSLSGTITEISNGFYKINLTNTELNGNYVILRFSCVGCDDTFVSFFTNA